MSWLNCVYRQRRDDNIPELPETLTLRRVVYQRKDTDRKALLTSLLEPSAYPAPQLAALYHERCELELGFDEVKTEMLDRQESLRSKHPDAVEQEVWGVLLAYNGAAGDGATRGADQRGTLFS